MRPLWILRGLSARASDCRQHAPPDSSFEAGLGAGWSVRCELASASLSAAFEPMDPRPVLYATTAADQTHSVKVDLPGDDDRFRSSGYNYGLPHTAGIWLKASAPGASARLELLESTQTKSFHLTSSWQHCALTTVIPYGDFTRLTRRTLPAAGTIWFGDPREGETRPVMGGAAANGTRATSTARRHFLRPRRRPFCTRRGRCPDGAVLRYPSLTATRRSQVQPASQEELRIESPTGRALQSDRPHRHCPPVCRCRCSKCLPGRPIPGTSL